MTTEYRKEIIRDLRTYVIDESLSNAAADEMEEMMEEIERREDDQAALQRAITALIKISEPRVGGGQWAAKVAQEALGTMTCGGEAEGDWVARYHKGQDQIEKLTDRIEELEYALSRMYSSFYVAKEALGESA
ncbi:MAG: hypothetical protein ACR2IJ_00470 [Fluviibacter sp.]